MRKTLLASVAALAVVPMLAACTENASSGDDGGKGGDSATKRAVQLGRRTSDFIEVLSGLKPGEKVITSSYSGLTDKDHLNFSSGD